MDYKLLVRCLDLAKESLENNCFPAGAVIINDQGVIISEGRNLVNEEVNRIKHAEMQAIMNCKEDLINSKVKMYTTLEPCFMCMGTSVINKVDEIIWLADDYWAGGSNLIKSNHSYFIRNTIRVRKYDDKRLLDKYIKLLRCYMKNNHELLNKILDDQSN